MHSKSALLCAAFGGVVAQAAWIPGFTPQTYRDGDAIPLLQSHVSPHLSSASVGALIKQPIFAFGDLPFSCPPSPYYPGSSSRIPLTLAQIARGDRITVAQHTLVFGIDAEYQPLCTIELDETTLLRTKNLIRKGYRAEWILDGLPGVRAWMNTTGTGRYFGRGVEIGGRFEFQLSKYATKKALRHEIYNHVSFLVRYRTVGRQRELDTLESLPETARKEEGKKLEGREWERLIVGFEMFPKSRKATSTMTKGDKEERVQIWPVPDIAAGSKTMKKGKKTQAVDSRQDEEKLKIPFTYSVYWREEKREDEGGFGWRNRWTPYSTAEEEAETTVQWDSGIWMLVFWVLLGYWIVRILAADSADENGENGVNSLSKPLRTVKTTQPQPQNKKTGKPKKSYGLLTQQGNNVNSPSSYSDDEDDHHLAISPPPRQSPFALYKNTFFPPLLGAGIQVLALIATIYPLFALKTLDAPYYSHFITFAILTLLALVPLSGYVSFHAHAIYTHRSLYSNTTPQSRPQSSSPHHALRQNALLTTSLLPALVLTATCVLNASAWLQAGGTVVPLPYLLICGSAWLLTQGALVYAGSWMALSELSSDPVQASPRTFSSSNPRTLHASASRPTTTTSTSFWKSYTPYAQTLLVYASVSTAPFLAAYLAAATLRLLSSCTLASSSVTPTHVSATLTCSASYASLRTWAAATTTTSGLLILGVAGVVGTVSVAVGARLASPYLLSSSRPGRRGGGDADGNADETLRSFTLGAAPAALLYVFLLAAYAANPLRPRGAVCAVLYGVYAGAGCVGLGAGSGVMGVLGSSLGWGKGSESGRGKGGAEGDRVGKSE